MAFHRWQDKGQISQPKWKRVLDALQVRRDFVAHHADQVAHLTRDKVIELSDGFLLREAYRAYWQRHLVDAQMLFRHAFFKRYWKAGDLKYLLPSLLPLPVFQTLVRTSDRLREKHK
jgi:hypothetical protein